MASAAVYACTLNLHPLPLAGRAQAFLVNMLFCFNFVVFLLGLVGWEVWFGIRCLADSKAVYRRNVERMTRCFERDFSRHALLTHFAGSVELFKNLTSAPIFISLQHFWVSGIPHCTYLFSSTQNCHAVTRGFVRMTIVWTVQFHPCTELIWFCLGLKSEVTKIFVFSYSRPYSILSLIPDSCSLWIYLPVTNNGNHL